MAAEQMWEYAVQSCYYKVTKTSLKGREGEWFLYVGGELPLASGLAHMGELGFELVAVQATQMLSAGAGQGQWYKPDYYYIFKRPKSYQPF